MKFLIALILVAAGEAASAQTVPLPRPRPAEQTLPAQAQTSGPSACRLRLTADVATAPSIAPLESPAGCAVADAVRLEAIILPDQSRVAVTPPAMLRCSMAEAIVRWVREDIAEAVERLGAPLKSIDNYASFDCRGRNNIVGARLSEHGRANALDIRLLRLTDGKVLRLTDAHISRDFREEIRKSACARFSTVLGPGSDGYHEDHVHLDLMERAPGRFRMCQWDVRDPEPPASEAVVPLPPPRPKIEPATASSRSKL